jgi:hypothetical protein
MHQRFRDRRRALRDASVRRQRRLWGSVVALAVLAGCAAAAAYSPLFTIAEIRVTGAGERAGEVREVVPVAPGENLLFADVPAADAAAERLPWVRDATVTRVPPSTLDVSVTVREPVAVVRVADASWLVAADGVLVGGGARDGLVRIDARAAALPSVGQPIEDADIRSALALQAGFPAPVRERVVRYEASPEGGLRVLVRLDDPEAEGVWFRVGDSGGVEAKGLAIELILDRGRTDTALDLDGSEWDIRVPDRPVTVAPTPPPAPAG